MQKNKKVSFKQVIGVILIAVALSLGIYLFIMYRNYSKIKAQSRQIVQENREITAQINRDKVLKSKLVAEFERCEELISNGQGNFNEFSYCQRYLEFIKSTDLEL